MYEQFFQYISRSQTQIKQQMVESITNAEAYPEQKATEDSTDIADDLSKYEGVMESVLSWSEDEWGEVMKMQRFARLVTYQFYLMAM